MYDMPTVSKVHFKSCTCRCVGKWLLLSFTLFSIANTEFDPVAPNLLVTSSWYKPDVRCHFMCDQSYCDGQQPHRSLQWLPRCGWLINIKTISMFMFLQVSLKDRDSLWASRQQIVQHITPENKSSRCRYIEGYNKNYAQGTVHNSDGIISAVASQITHALYMYKTTWWYVLKVFGLVQ